MGAVIAMMIRSIDKTCLFALCHFLFIHVEYNMIFGVLIILQLRNSRGLEDGRGWGCE